jgi:hypothetical protein
MNHQIEQAGNVGLEVLRPGLGRFVAVGMNFGGHKRLAMMKQCSGAFTSRRRASYRGNGAMFQVGGRKGFLEKKKRTGWEGSRRSAGLRGKAPIQLPLGGWGAEKPS